MLSDLCHDEFDFAWRRPTPQFIDSEDDRDILQRTCSAISAVDIGSYNRDSLSAAVGDVTQTGGYSYGHCMKVLRRAVCGPKVCTTCTQYTTILLAVFRFICVTVDQWRTEGRVTAVRTPTVSAECP